MFYRLLISVLFATSLGCTTTLKPASPDILALTTTSFSSGKAVASAAKAFAVANHSKAGCLAAASFETAFQVAGDVVKTWPVAMIPSVSVDVSECMPFKPALDAELEVEIQKALSLALPITDFVVMTILGKVGVGESEQKLAKGLITYFRQAVPLVLREVGQKVDGQVTLPAVSLE